MRERERETERENLRVRVTSVRADTLCEIQTVCRRVTFTPHSAAMAACSARADEACGTYSTMATRSGSREGGDDADADDADEDEDGEDEVREVATQLPSRGDGKATPPQMGSGSVRFTLRKSTNESARKSASNSRVVFAFFAFLVLAPPGLVVVVGDTVEAGADVAAGLVVGFAEATSNMPKARLNPSTFFTLACKCVALRWC